MADAPTKTSLKQLTAFFVRSTGDEALDDATRAFAAKCALLGAHVQRVEALAMSANIKADAGAAMIAELTEYMIEEKQKASGGGPSSPPPPSGGPEDAGEGEVIDDDDEEAATQAMVDKITAETEAEERAIAAKPPTAITPLRKPGKQGKPSAPAPAAADGTGDAS